MVAAARPDWLPDFCRLPRLAAACVIAELVVLVISLTPVRSDVWLPEDFFAASAFALWIALDRKSVV